jgi:hypothetical protein
MSMTPVNTGSHWRKSQRARHAVIVVMFRRVFPYEKKKPPTVILACVRA